MYRAADRRTDTTGRRAARARRTSTDRAIERNENTASRRATRAQQPSDVRAVLRRENTERRRVARNRTMSESRARRRAGASTCSRSVWNELPLHRTPNPTPITLGSVEVCSYCRARLLQHEESSFCCRYGKLAVEPLPALPSGWIEMFTDPMFRKNSRKYNNFFCFSAIGVEGREGFVPETDPSCVKIHGRTYHRVLPCNLKGSLRWYVHDPDERMTEARSFSLPSS